MLLCLDRRYLWQAIESVKVDEPPVLFPVVTLNGQWPPGRSRSSPARCPCRLDVQDVSSIGTPATTCSSCGTVTDS